MKKERFSPVANAVWQTLQGLLENHVEGDCVASSATKKAVLVLRSVLIGSRDNRSNSVGDGDGDDGDGAMSTLFGGRLTCASAGLVDDVSGFAAASIYLAAFAFHARDNPVHAGSVVLCCVVVRRALWSNNDPSCHPRWVAVSENAVFFFASGRRLIRISNHTHVRLEWRARRSEAGRMAAQGCPNGRAFFQHQWLFIVKRR